MSDYAVMLEEYEVPEGWVLASLADLAVSPKSDIVDGPFGSNLKASEYTDSGVPIVRLQNIKRNYFLDKNINFVTPEKYEQLIRHTYKAGDLLITKLGSPLGVACIAPASMGEGVIVADLVRARLPEEFVNTKYIAYLINSPLVIQQFKENTKGTTRPRVNLKFVRALQLPIAPFVQQNRIVAKIEELFSHIDAGIAALNKAKQLLKQYRQSVLKSAVNGELTKQWREENEDKLEPASQLLERILQERRQKWEVQKLEQFKGKGRVPKDEKWKTKYKEPEYPDKKRTHDLPGTWCWATFNQISERVTVGHVGSMKNEYISTGVPFLRSQNVRENRYDPLGLKYISEDFHQKLKKSSLEPGDLVTVRSGSVGVTCVIPEFLKVANCADLVIVKQPKAANPKYAAYYMNTITQTKVAAEKVGVALTHFNTKSMAEMPLPLPSMKEQGKIVEFVDMKTSDIERLDSVIEKQLKKAEKNKQSILASAYSGNLVDHLDTDGSAKDLLEGIEASGLKDRKKKPVRIKPQKRGKGRVVKKLILDVLKERGEIEVSSLMQEAGYEQNEVEEFYEDLSVISGSFVENRPAGPKAKLWPYDEEIKLRLK